MNTKILRLDDFIRTGKLTERDLPKIEETAEVLRNGGLAAIPTETVYGLGGNALLADAASRIYMAKGRPSDNPLIVHIAEISALSGVASSIPDTAYRLAECFWPGPLTMVLSKNPVIPDATTGGLSTVAVRMPVHEVARKVIALSGVPVAAPSANRSGRPSTTTAEHCIEDLFGRVDLILDGGPSSIGVESTILDLSGAEPELLRPGAVTMEMLTGVLGRAPLVDPAVLGPLSGDTRPRAPGMKYRHYAPKAPLLVVRGREGTGEEKVFQKIRELSLASAESGQKTEVLCSEECAHFLMEKLPETIRIRTFGKRNGEEIARNLFSVLRDTDEEAVDQIIAEGFGETDLFMAVMNRMKKASGWHVTEV